ncbi:hypothetical protein JKF63_06324 [Porcisia hertigi]|uniref:Uncharacterized protein n=1 Tax=Porcisia hertigi TaxID=2761500 RepID=A0A836IHH1_9TRYP|nr:hypothetical protein JKF63_06324 [Porcisia hertigi]
MGSLVFSSLAALAVVLTLISAAYPAEAQGLRGLLALQMKGYTGFSSDTIADSGTTVTYMTTEMKCFSVGGTPASNANNLLSNSVGFWMDLLGGTSSSTVYTGSSASPSRPDTRCAELVNGTATPKNSANCYYRWRYGYYDAYSHEGEPGTAYWVNLYLHPHGPSQILNQFEQFTWHPPTTHPPQSYPRGHFGGIASLNRQTRGLYRLDAPLTPVDNDPYPRASYMIVCEQQLYPELPPVSTRMPQPAFVNGFRSLTWSESNWWVLFLIPAILILVTLVAIVVYCCITSMSPKEEPPLFQMVIRERVGKAYAVQKELSMVVPQPYAAPSSTPPQQKLSPQQEEQRRRQMRYGQGFNPRQRSESEDMSLGVASIYNNSVRNQYANGNAFDTSEGSATGRDLEGIHGNRFCEATRQFSKREEEDGNEGLNDASTIVMSRRRSERRIRSRTQSQTFDEVEVPEAGEINENNIDL